MGSKNINDYIHTYYSPSQTLTTKSIKITKHRKSNHNLEQLTLEDFHNNPMLILSKHELYKNLENEKFGSLSNH